MQQLQVREVATTIEGQTDQQLELELGMMR